MRSRNDVRRGWDWPRRRACCRPIGSPRVVERNITVYRRTWVTLLSGFFEPVFYLLSIGIGIGELVGDVTVGGRTVDYRTFVAPGLLATSAMNGTFYDSTMNMYYKLTWAKIYDAVLATPVGVVDLALGRDGLVGAAGHPLLRRVPRHHGRSGAGGLVLGHRRPAGRQR